jgi:hypothetical protein
MCLANIAALSGWNWLAFLTDHFSILEFASHEFLTRSLSVSTTFQRAFAEGTSLGSLLSRLQFFFCCGGEPA